MGLVLAVKAKRAVLVVEERVGRGRWKAARRVAVVAVAARRVAVAAVVVVAVVAVVVHAVVAVVAVAVVAAAQPEVTRSPQS